MARYTEIPIIKLARETGIERSRLVKHFKEGNELTQQEENSVADKVDELKAQRENRRTGLRRQP